VTRTLRSCCAVVGTPGFLLGDVWAGRAFCSVVVGMVARCFQWGGAGWSRACQQGFELQLNEGARGCRRDAACSMAHVQASG
jgi:hypothetical protein